MTDQIEFSKPPGKWVMRITADRRIEVNEDVTVTEAAQTVLEALQTLLEQPERKPLTDADIKLVMDGRGEEGDDDYIKPAFDPYGISEGDLIDFARAIEQAHGIKENT
tara:strand:- start:510 stop:833 length:324 start_codon:yes stop_codon:yes gene_type:complete